MKVKEESEKVGLKLSIQKTEIMTSSPITSVTDFIFLGSKITVYGDYSHEIKTLAPGRKAMIKLDSVLKSRDITSLPTKVHTVKAMVFPVVVYRCEIWAIKKAEH